MISLASLCRHAKRYYIIIDYILTLYISYPMKSVSENYTS